MVDVDVAIIGAGVTGIAAAYRFQTGSKLSYQIFESREEIGGTWSLFNFAGARSDIDMFSYGFPFRPWTGPESVAEGWQIRQYIEETARENGIDKRIKFHHKVQSASWSSEQRCWTLHLSIRRGEGEVEKSIKARFVLFATGYFRYDRGYSPKLNGQELYHGAIIHPQFWPKEVEYRNKKVVIIGSGATATTLLPSMAQQVGEGTVTILQRSPSYYITIPRTKPLANLFRSYFPLTAHALLRFMSASADFCFFIWCRICPNVSRRFLRYHVARQLPKEVPLDPHFDPKYMPWEQRLCMVPEGDFFKALHPGGKGHIVTGEIDSFAHNGIRLTDGTFLDADMVVQATGLEILAAGGVSLTVDGNTIKTSDCWVYRGFMFSDLPNLAFALGSFFQGWTLGADIACRSFVKLANHMTKNGHLSATPKPPSDLVQDKAMHVSSGYLVRGKESFPKSSTRKPWKSPTEWISNWWDLRFSKVDQDIVFT